MAGFESNKHEPIYAEFDYFRNTLLNNYETCSSKDDIGTVGMLLLGMSCSSNLTDILETLLLHFDVIVGLQREKTHSQVLYECIEIANGKKNDDVVRILLQFAASKVNYFASTITDEVSGCLTVLQFAAVHGDVEIIAMLLDSGFDVNQTNYKGETALHYACNAVTAAVLITNGADVNAMNKNNETPLYYAGTSCRLGVIRTLLDSGAKPNLGSYFLPPDITCEWSNDRSIADALLQACEDAVVYSFEIPATCVWYVMYKNSVPNWDSVYEGLYCTTCKHENQLLIRGIEDKEAQHKTEYTYEYPPLRRVECRGPPLHSAINSCHEIKMRTGFVDIDEIKAILSISDPATVNTIDNFGATALYHAVRNNLIEVATVLLDSGADPNLTTSGKYPIIEACRHLSHEFVELLLTRGADPNVVDTRFTPMCYAVRSLDYRLVEMLIEHGADVNYYRQYNGTAFGSIQNCFDIKRCKSPGIARIKMAEHLIDKGFNLNPIDAYNCLSVLFNVTSNVVQGDLFHCWLFELVLERGADVNFFNSSSKTVTQHPFVVGEFLRRGGDPNRPDGHGRNLLGVAFAESSLRCARLLLAAGADPNLITWDSLGCVAKNTSAHADMIDMFLNSGMKFNVSTDTYFLYKPPKLSDLWVPFCEETECIQRLFKAGSNLKTLASWCSKRCRHITSTIRCPSAGCMCKAAVLAGHRFEGQDEFVETLKNSESHYARDLGLWLEEDSMTPPSLLRLSRNVIRRQLTAASGCRTILPLIDVLPISNPMRLYLKFEGPYSEINLSEISISQDPCCVCR